MAERDKRKGTVTPLSSALPAEEARKAAERVADAISHKESELNNLHYFAADNANLINLVKRLPDELHHDIMVPFGKAAFFPGRLIHTNEFLVLLGEGYYAERTSKQTIDILKRRGKALESQVDALNGMIKDLRLEASFFNSTAAEADEGLLEIREEYVEEDSKQNTFKTGLKKSDKPSIFRPQSVTNVASDAEEIKARMDELEIQEEKYDHTDDREFAKMMARMDELEREEEAAEAAAAVDDDDDDDADAQRTTDLGNWVPEDQDSNCHENVADKLKMGSLGLQSSLKGESFSKKDLPDNVKERPAQMDMLASQMKMGIQTASMPHNVKERSAQIDMVASQMKTGIQTASKSNYKVPVETYKPAAGARISKPITDSQKAFTGSIVEHTDNLPANPVQQTLSQPSSSQSSKPASRFKMQRS